MLPIPTTSLSLLISKLWICEDFPKGDSKYVFKFKLVMSNNKSFSSLKAAVNRGYLKSDVYILLFV
jgi:hypothetical protein